VLYVEGGQYPDVLRLQNEPELQPLRRSCLSAHLPDRRYLQAGQKDGIVDIDSTLCIGCRRCEGACPYGAPQYDPTEHIVKKCNMCIDELEAGRKPYCVMACMMRVLDIGPIDALRAGTYPTTAIGPGDRVTGQVKDMANPALTHPSIVFVPHRRGRVDE
jgi:anaerobic dimethyl sulfoxide reductase subunit B (iron-sulfur subunit)